MDSERKRSAGTGIVLALVALWFIWCALYSYITFYIPAWQQDQAATLEFAISRDCLISMIVTPASIEPSDSPYWSRLYPLTGKDIECRVDPASKSWYCTKCGDR